MSAAASPHGRQTLDQPAMPTTLGDLHSRNPASSLTLDGHHGHAAPRARAPSGFSAGEMTGSATRPVSSPTAKEIAKRILQYTAIAVIAFTFLAAILAAAKVSPDIFIPIFVAAGAAGVAGMLIATIRFLIERNRQNPPADVRFHSPTPPGSPGPYSGEI